MKCASFAKTSWPPSTVSIMTKRKNPNDLKPAGRPSTYSQESADEICRRIIAGEGLREICRDETMPARETVYGWLAVRPEFQHQYARAREYQADAWGDELLAIAHDGTNDFRDRIAADGSVERVLDNEHVQRSKLRVDTLKWLMSKHAPRRFGDKVEVEVSGGLDVENLSDAELESRTRAALARLGIEAPDGPLLLGPTNRPAVDQDDAQGGI